MSPLGGGIHSYPFLPFHWETEFWCYASAKRFAMGGPLATSFGRIFYGGDLKATSASATHYQIIERLSRLGDSGELSESIARVAEELYSQGIVRKIVGMVPSASASPEHGTSWKQGSPPWMVSFD